MLRTVPQLCLSSEIGRFHDFSMVLEAAWALENLGKSSLFSKKLQKNHVWPKCDPLDDAGTVLRTSIESRDTDLKSKKKLEQKLFFFWEKNDFENFDFRKKQLFPEKKIW